MNILKQLQKVSAAAEKHKAELNKFSAMFEKRYGADFSDVDCDPIIDVTQGQGNPPSTLEALDAVVLDYNDLSPQ